MSAVPASPMKVCVVCRTDVAKLPRVKDPQGQYYCKTCYDGARKEAVSKHAAPAKPKPTAVVQPPRAKTANPAATSPTVKPKTAVVKPPPRREAVAAEPEAPVTLDDFMTDFGSDAQGDPGVPPLGAMAAALAPCPNCSAPLTPGAVLCTGCGYNLKSGKKLKGAAARSATAEKASAAAAAVGNYVRGVIFACIGAGIGAALWSGVAIATNYEIGYIAWALGGLAGLGMQIGYGDNNEKAGLTAAGISLVGIGASKILIVYFILKARPEFGPNLSIFDLISFDVIKMTMGPMDFLFIFLAVATAYRVGAHGASGGD